MYFVFCTFDKIGKCWRPGALQCQKCALQVLGTRVPGGNYSRLEPKHLELIRSKTGQLSVSTQWCFIPNYNLQFQKFLPCSLLYILAAHKLSRPALIFSLIHSPRENRTQIRLPESINTLQPEQLFTLYYTSVHCLRRNSDLKVGFPESINSSLLPRLCLT